MAVSKKKQEKLENERLEKEKLAKSKLDANYPIPDGVLKDGEGTGGEGAGGEGAGGECTGGKGADILDIDEVEGFMDWEKVCSVKNKSGYKKTYAMPCGKGLLVEVLIKQGGVLTSSMTFVPGGELRGGKILY